MARIDVAIIGGGPAGTTCATLLCKYNPRLRVTVLEREEFPRDHVGESQLPAIGPVLEEMGVWDKIEAAGFPVKIGATYRWGRTDDLWDFDFLAGGRFQDEPRPARYRGQRRQTAFQIDRAIFDKILLDHAAAMGADVRTPQGVRRVLRNGDRVTGLELEDGSMLEAETYVDASGHAGILRRAMEVEVQCPTSLQNIAIWDYWQNADWAVKIGVGGTRIQVLSLGYGWIWFIPLGPTRTSIGLVVPARYYKVCGKKPEELYRDAVLSDRVVGRLLNRATSEGKLSTTKDWSFVADRLAGANWYLAGECAGFADPILSAGMTLAHLGARDVAYAILAERRRDYDGAWLREWYDASNRFKIGQHIRFADFWYSANGVFDDLKQETQRIAKDAGLEMTPEEAWRWLGTGGFVDADAVGSGMGGFSLGAVKSMAGNFLGTGPRYLASGKNVFHLDLEGTAKGWGARLADGRMVRHRTYRRGDKALPNVGLYGLLIGATRGGGTGAQIWDTLNGVVGRERLSRETAAQFAYDAFEALESMIADGWLRASFDPSLPVLGQPENLGGMLHPNLDVVSAP